MFSNKRKIVINTIGVIFFVGILSFAYFRYSRYRIGPEIVSINIEKFMSTEEPSLSINAEIKNTQLVTINNRNITLQNKKTFNEILVFSPGTNIIDIGLEDAFGKIKSYTYSIYYRSQETEYPKTLVEALLEKDLSTKELEAKDELIEINE